MNGDVKPLSEMSVNTILTMVIRLKQPMTVKVAKDDEYDIVWNRTYNQPEVLHPKHAGVDVRGISQTLKWLESQSDDVHWYAQTKRHTQHRKT